MLSNKIKPRAQKANDIYTHALKVLRVSMVNKPGEIAKVVDYGKSANSPLENHLDWGGWAISWIM